MTRGSNGPHEGTIIIPSTKLDNSLKQRIPIPPKDMDDYYFRPRGGEFLTRGAALASAQLVTPDYGVTTGTACPIGSASRGSLASHLDSIGVTSTAAAAVAAQQRLASQAAITGITTVSISRLQAAGSKEKYGERRNPTILRKSEIEAAFFFSHHFYHRLDFFRIGSLYLLHVQVLPQNGSGGRNKCHMW